MAIPRIIHQTYRDADVPEALRAGIAELRAMNPGWEYRFYDDAAVADFIRHEFPPEFYRAYCRINPIYGPARADFFRYLVVYRYGGVYLDLKSATTRPLDDSLRSDDDYVLSYWPNQPHQTIPGAGMHRVLLEQGFLRGEFQNWHVMAAAEHSLLRYVISMMMHCIQAHAGDLTVAGKYGVLMTTGPIMYTLALGRGLGAFPHRVVDTHLDLGLNYSSVAGHERHFPGHYSTLTAPVVLAPQSGT
ncbi:MAG: glycosyltransferase [Proteobacteria bacterium]|nr:glycosyltransferase [Burkholderiales bacterium]MCA0309335.1 glycosyltransferase [Pseudomonadota bacterium]